MFFIYVHIRESFNILSDHIRLDIHGISNLLKTDSGQSCGMRNDTDIETVPAALIYGKTDPIYCNGSFFN